MNRIHQFVFVVSTLLLSWLGMLAFHEFGHVVGAWFTGGEVTKVVLHPLAISRTDVSPNPHPLAVVWAGPILGCLLPLLGWSAAASLEFLEERLARLFCGICLIANGAYIGMGAFGRIGDAGVMLRHGSEPWHLWVFGLLASAAGLYLCHGLGPRFGFGESRGGVNKTTAYVVFVLTLVVVLLELCLSEAS